MVLRCARLACESCAINLFKTSCNVVDLFMLSSIARFWLLGIGQDSVHFILGVFFEVIIRAVVNFACNYHELYLSCTYHVFFIP